MAKDMDRLSRMLRFWGRVGFFFFLACALVLFGILLVEGIFTLRALIVVCAIAALGLLSLGLARFYGWMADRLVHRN